MMIKVHSGGEAWLNIYKEPQMYGLRSLWIWVGVIRSIDMGGHDKERYTIIRRYVNGRFKGGHCRVELVKINLV
jgi:hypothetical protein